ncbi:3'-5' exonuclease [Chthoniobacter flavus Ellin428]|uniref:3'-5' exonuclease n=1 Tax=Chthoniobacter flavus Ellin428 TaxID=497964 RepID=B4D6R3_9BACT|nr:HRDC domain-containing protein [Chthoniobacter flavus]EDY17864.1 3'-5' exonuclease [Chthoniobacter flavus Ellin428]TCO88475.1 ribonuclease D [Chthoniobacter flavus]
MQPLIDTAEALQAVPPLLAPHPRIPIDTEADSLHCYFEKLCLIQISVPGHDLLIDPLAGISLQPLFEAFAGKELIIHGADYDLRLLRRVGFTVTAPVFDTMIAARLCGIEEFSLAALIKRYFDVALTKASQKANWARRPLSPQMADYAVKDTHYLLEIAGILEAELTRLDRMEWFRQSCDKAVAASAITKERDPEEVWRITGSKDLRGRASAILRALWHWREAEAQAVDRPTFHILHSEQLIEAAAKLDRDQEVDFSQLHGPRRRRFYEAVETAKALPESEWPKIIRKPRPRPTRDEEARFRELKTKRDAAAAELKLDPSLIAPKSMLESLAANGAEATARMLPWQRATLGV